MRPAVSGFGGRRGRRDALRLTLAAAALLVAGGHAPYGQWGVYRKRYLLVLTARTDPQSFALGKRLAAVLADALPESRAQVSRAPHKQRIASLLSSKQMDLALMQRNDAAALRRGAPPFTDYGSVPLYAIVGLGAYLLVCRDDFPARHAWLVAEALSKRRHVLPVALTPAATSAEPPDARLPLHPGAQAYFNGDPLPDPEPKAEDDHGHEHKRGTQP